MTMSVMKKPRKPLTKIVQPDVRMLSIDGMKVCPDLLQTRDGTDIRVSQVYAKAKATGSVFPPVRVMDDGTDFWLYDGFTRVHAWKSLGLAQIEAVVRKGTVDEALLLGIEANFNPDNIREVKENDRQHAVELMICNEQFRVWSDTEIGRRCGLGGHTVMKMRLRLNETLGIPLPERVLAFQDGSPNGRTRRYRQPKGLIQTRLADDQCRYSVCDGGKVKDLGRDLGKASELYQEITRKREEMATVLGDNWKFRDWLMRRRIHATSVPPEVHVSGGTLIGSALIQAIASPDMVTFLASSARLLYGRAAQRGVSRAILVGYIIGADSKISRLLPDASALGIEVMTPEEFVAEFGPKGAPDDDQAPPAPIGPAAPEGGTVDA
jgi:hypothetical protein